MNVIGGKIPEWKVGDKANVIKLGGGFLYMDRAGMDYMGIKPGDIINGSEVMEVEVTDE